MFVDLSFKVSFNEVFFFYFFIFWTNFWYIFSFFFLLYLVLLSFSVKSINLPVVLIFLFFYNYETCAFLGSSTRLDFLSNKYDNSNLFLLNNLNKIHPFIFYVSTLLILLKALETAAVNFFKPIFSKEFYCATFGFFSLIFIIIYATLFLGSWWALQEGSWGGWWNWDSSETFGTIFFFF